MAKCSQCTYQGGDYLNHTCVTGFKPTQIEHQDALTGGRFSRVSEKALERGEQRKGEGVAPKPKKKAK